LRFEGFPRHEGAVAEDLVTSKRPPIPVFVSHRWVGTEHPDPNGSQRHIVLRFLVEAVAMSKGLLPHLFSYAPPEARVNPRLEAAIRVQEPQELGFDEDPEWFEGPGHTVESLLPLWLKTNFPFLRFEREEIEQICAVLKQIGVWYDYSCMPQRPFRTQAEQTRFEVELRRLPDVMKSSHVLIAWDRDSNDRGWCLLEGIIAAEAGIVSFDAVPNTN